MEKPPKDLTIFLLDKRRNRVKIGLVFELGAVFCHRIFAQAKQVGLFFDAEAEERKNHEIALRLAKVGVGRFHFLNTLGIGCLEGFHDVLQTVFLPSLVNRHHLLLQHVALLRGELLQLRLQLSLRLAKTMGFVFFVTPIKIDKDNQQ